MDSPSVSPPVYAPPTPAVAGAATGSTATATVTTADASASGAHGHSLFWSGEDFSFGDVLDTINPLQHLPVIGSIYRAITGERIGHLPQLLGDTLYGGAVGAASAVANIATEEITGKDIGGQVLALLGVDDGSAPPTQLASAGGVPAAQQPSHVVALSRGAMDPEDRRGDVTGGIDDGRVFGAPTFRPMLPNTAIAAAPASAPAAPIAGPIAGSGLTVPAGGALAAAMAMADAAVSAGLSGLDGSAASALAQAPARSLPAASQTAALTTGTGNGTAAGAAPNAVGGLRPSISSSQGGMVRSLSGQMLSNHSIPLNLPNGLTGGVRRAPGFTSRQNAPQNVGLGLTAANDIGTGAGAPGATIDISQRMIDALDRYNQLEAARKAAQASSVNGRH